MLQKLNDIEKRFESIEEQLMDPSINTRPSELQRLGKARAELDELVGAIRNSTKTLQALEETQELLEDPEMKEMAQEELPGLKTLAESLENDLKAMLIPKDPNDGKPIIVEIRPAAGGDEAGLFASEIFRMYTRYCERNRWKYEVLDHEETGLGSLSRVVFTITAPGAYGLLKFESGVHRVQRVPATESGGRIHTSTITVAIMPEVEEAEIDIKAEDIEVSTFCSSSAGGQ
ncbi:MAG: PCRF domain-containing protein, partial [Armatimonadetes bacterium]|nr:PCRF domain-containing protein [Armatimonadota bacterium]